MRTYNERPSARSRRRAANFTLRAALLTALCWLVPAAAQDADSYAGTYVLHTGSGPIIFTFERAGTSLVGRLVLDGQPYELEGELDAEGAYGTIWTGQESLYFEAELRGQNLYMIMAQLDPVTGAPDPATAGEYLFERADSARPSTPPSTPSSTPPASPP